MKTIDIKCLEWFDKINGNSYFSALVTVDFGLETEQIIKLPFQYGYGDHYIYQSIEELRKLNLLDSSIENTRHLKENNIALRHSKISALQRDCKNLVK